MSDDPNLMYAQHMLDDAGNRVKWQQDISQAGMRILMLINGGAILSLLTYIGNSASRLSADRFELALGAYGAGLVLAVVSYLPAYFSQGLVLRFSEVQAWRYLGFPVSTDEVAKADRNAKWAKGIICLAVLATVLSLVGFTTGSVLATKALASQAAPILSQRARMPNDPSSAVEPQRCANPH